MEADRQDAAEPATEAGDRLGSRYVLMGILGSGSMGHVYPARDAVTGQEFAAKVLHVNLLSHDDIMARFLQEFRILQGISHPNIIRVHDLVLENNRLAIIMDLARGGDLSGRAREGLPVDQALRVSTQVFEALAAAHAGGIVHRDLTPANVLIDPTPDNDLAVKLTDFGVSRLVNSTRTHTGMLIGTPKFMFPEGQRGEPATSKSDIYSAGMLLKYLIEGRRFRVPVPGQQQELSFAPETLPQRSSRPLFADSRPMTRANDRLPRTRRPDAGT